MRIAFVASSLNISIESNVGDALVALFHLEVNDRTGFKVVVRPNSKFFLIFDRF